MAFPKAERLSQTVQRCISCALLAFSASAFAAWSRQSQSPQPSAPSTTERPLLQAITLVTSSDTSERYLYVRVFADARVEYHDPLKIDLTKPVPVVAKKLNPAEITRLAALLSLPEIQDLSGTFEREDLGIFHETWSIEIHRGPQVQNVSLVNFHSDGVVPGRPRYTEPAIILGCMIDRLEHKAKSSDWQMEECKNLLSVR